MNNKNPQLDLSNQLCFPLYACSRKIVNLYTPHLKDLDLTYTEYLVLLVLWEKDNILVKDICNRLHLDNGTISPLLKKMESKDMIKRVRSTEDDRKVLISLSDKGKTLENKCKDIPFEIAKGFDLDKEEAQILYKTLYKIINQ